MDMSNTTYPLSTGLLSLALQAEGKRLRLSQYADQDVEWLHPASQSHLFSVYVNGKRYDASNLEFMELNSDRTTAGVEHYTARFRARSFEVEQHIKVYAGTALIEIYPVLRNHGQKACRINRMDAFSFDLQNHDLLLQYYTSRGEANLNRALPVTQVIRLQTRSGRSNGQRPWFGLMAPGERCSRVIAWSGLDFREPGTGPVPAQRWDNNWNRENPGRMPL
jgi:hypothetical protein